MSDGISILEKHLAKVKATSKETIAKLQAQNAQLEDDNTEMRTKVQALLDEVRLRSYAPV